jgi:hypothetical protein
LRPSDPLRPPDWCWRRAVFLHDVGQPLPQGVDGALVEAALGLISELVRIGSQAVLPEPHESDTPLARAHAIYAGQRARQRSVLEAWILTGLPAERIAARCGLDEEVVQLYENVFFDIRDRLGDEGFITHRVLDLWPPPAPTLDTVLKRFAFTGGPMVLEHLIELFGVAGSPDQVQLSLRDRLSLAAAVASFLLPVTRKTAAPILRLQLLLTGPAWRHDPKVFREVVGRLVRLLLRFGQIVDEDLLRTFSMVEDLLSQMADQHTP